MPLNRRTFLKASGVSLALPFLESMTPVLAKPTESGPKRMVLICTTLGLHPPSLWPRTPGYQYESTEYLELLQEHRKDLTLFSGLSHQNQTGRQPHDSQLSWLTAAQNPGTAGFRNTISMDQVAVNKLGYITRFPSIALGSDSTLSQSYTRNGVMIPSETSPANLFAKLFLQGRPSEIERQKRQLNQGRSILDQLGSEADKIRRRASAADNNLLEDYFDAVRQAEKEISAVQDWMEKPKPSVSAQPPIDVQDRADIVGRMQLLMDLIPLIIQTDSSRVVNVMIQDHYTVPKIGGVTGNHHNLSHHGQDKGKIDQLRKIESKLVGCLGNLLRQMKSRSELGSSLLDNTSVLFGSNLGNANAHHARNLPILLAGGGFKHGQYVAYDQSDNIPLSNLFITMLNNMEIETKSFGQSNGELSW